MKLLGVLLLLTGFCRAQTITPNAQRDSVPVWAGIDRMPNARTSNSFYRYLDDPKNVVRATLDNMPIHVPDSSASYTMLRSVPRLTDPNLLKLPRMNPPLRRFRK